MANNDVILSQRYAAEAKIAAATAKVYAQSNSEYANDSAASATEASGYATNAEASATLAEQYYDYATTLSSFFIGALSSAPSTRIDGTAVQVGDMYKNTTDNVVYSYNSDGSWSSLTYDETKTEELYSAGQELYSVGQEYYDYSVKELEKKVNTSELYAYDGPKLIGRCPDLATLATIEPTVDWQVIDVISRIANCTWGGGDFTYVPTATSSLYPSIPGAIIWTSGGKCWIRKSLLDIAGKGKIYAEWFSDVPEGLTQDWASALNAANNAAETMVASLNPIFGRHIEIVCPRFFGIKSSVIINVNAAFLNGNNGSCCVSSSGTYTAHPMIGNTSYTSSATAVANFTYAFGLLGSTVSTSVSNYSCYFTQEYVKNLSIAYGTAASDIKLPYTEITSDPGSYVTAFVHFGKASSASESNVTGTVQTSQGSFSNVAVNGFGCGYSNGNYAWGVNFYECKWTGNFYSQFLVSGTDNGERYNFFGNVWQNGYHGYWSENWSGDTQFSGGSMVWLRGKYIKAAAYNMFDAQLSRVEHVLSTSELVYMDDAGLTSSTYYNWNKCKFRPTLVIISRNSSTTTQYDWFRVGQYRELEVSGGAWSWNSYSLSPNVRLANPDALGRLTFTGNPMRIGAWRQFKQVPKGLDNRAAPLYRLSSTYAETTANSSYSYTFGNTSHNVTGYGDLTISCNVTTTANYFANFLVPIDPSRIRNLRDLFPYLKASSNTFSTALIISVYLRSDAIYGYGSAGSSGDLEYKVGDITLNGFTSTSEILLYPGGGTTPLYYDNIDSLPFIPTHLRFNIYFAGTIGGTAGQSITITDAGLAGF